MVLTVELQRMKTSAMKKNSKPSVQQFTPLANHVEDDDEPDLVVIRGRRRPWGVAILVLVVAAAVAAFCVHLQLSSSDDDGSPTALPTSAPTMSPAPTTAPTARRCEECNACNSPGSSCDDTRDYMYPQYCAGTAFSPDEAGELAISYMPYYTTCFAFHEIAKHATCSAFPSADEYLVALRDAVAFVRGTTAVRFMEENAPVSVERAALYDMFDTVVTMSCYANCDVNQLFTCWDASEDGAFVPQLVDCYETLIQSYYSGSCAACDVINVPAPHNTTSCGGRYLVNGTSSNGLPDGAARPGDADSYVLAVTWENSYASCHGDDDSPYNNTFTPHGLWPQFAEHTSCPADDANVTAPPPLPLFS